MPLGRQAHVLLSVIIVSFLNYMRYFHVVINCFIISIVFYVLLVSIIPSRRSGSSDASVNISSG
jgi:phage shock protein PspC (stress-responsive transcriptional regulator)